MVSPWTIFPALVVVSAVAVATFLLEFIKRTERKHSAESAAAASEFFQDPISSKQVACPSISDPAEKYMSLIIPAFNEEQRLPGALEDTMDYLQQRAAADKSFTYEVVIVDDGSTDGTSKVAFDFVRKHTINNVRVILLGRNHGKGEAIRKQLIEAIQFCESIVKQGMLHSRGELLLMVDADGATKVSDLEKLEHQICTLAEKEFKSGGTTHGNLSPKISDIAVAAFGSRAHLEKQALATRKWYRNFLMKGFHLVVLLTAGPGIRDTQCGFKMFTRAAARKLFTNIRLKRWMDVLSHICRKGPSLNIPLSIPFNILGHPNWHSGLDINLSFSGMARPFLSVEGLPHATSYGKHDKQGGLGVLKGLLVTYFCTTNRNHIITAHEGTILRASEYTNPSHQIKLDRCQVFMICHGPPNSDENRICRELIYWANEC